MGIQATHLYFSKGFLKMKTIRDKFNEITGLELRLILNEELIDSEEEEEKILQNIPSPTKAGFSCFYVEGFYSIYIVDYYGDNKTFELECGGADRYFYQALLKTFYELGAMRVNRNFGFDGAPFNNINMYLDSYNRNDPFWADINKWNNYNESEKPEK